MPSPTFQRPREDLRQRRAIATEITCRAGGSLFVNTRSGLCKRVFLDIAQKMGERS